MKTKYTKFQFQRSIEVQSNYILFRKQLKVASILWHLSIIQIFLNFCTSEEQSLDIFFSKLYFILFDILKYWEHTLSIFTMVCIFVCPFPQFTFHHATKKIFFCKKVQLRLLFYSHFIRWLRLIIWPTTSLPVANLKIANLSPFDVFRT